MFNYKSIATAALLSAFAIGSAFTGKLATTTFKVDTKKSQLNWYASKVTGKHNGTVNLASGSVESDGKTIIGGSFDIDMTSILVKDIPADNEMNGKLLGHLKSDDFFSVDKHKTARFEIMKVVPNGKEFQVAGKMTIKGITNEISFPATISTSDKGVTAKAKITLDRTKWDVRYGSNKFFEGLADKAIHDDFVIEVNLVAGK